MSEEVEVLPAAGAAHGGEVGAVRGLHQKVSTERVVSLLMSCACMHTAPVPVAWSVGCKQAALLSRARF